MESTLEIAMKQQLLESLGYIEITRGCTRPVPLDQILQRRMDDFLSRRLNLMNANASTISLRDL